MRRVDGAISALSADFALTGAGNRAYYLRISCGDNKARGNVYIWEKPDWPKLRWDDDRLASLLAAVSRDQGRLLGKMEALGFDLRNEANLAILTEDVTKSSEIEGEKLPPDQVRSSIARRLGMDVGGLAPVDRNVEGIVEMMLDATAKYADPLTEERLFAWHAALFPTGRSGMRWIVAGHWRTEEGPVQVVSGPVGREKIHFEAPPADRLPAEMEQFLRWFNDPGDADPLLIAGSRTSVVRHPAPVRRRQRPDRSRHRRHGAGAIGRDRPALLQHVGANP